MFANIVLRSFSPKARRPRRLAVEALEAREVPAVDQVFNPPEFSGSILSTGVAAFNTNQEQAQTFTVGVSGILTQVDVYIHRWEGTIGDLVLDIRGTQADGRPTSLAGQQLLTTARPATDVPALPAGPNMFSFDLTGFNVYVGEGEKLAAILRVAPAAGGDSHFRWEGRTEDRYPRGVFYGRVVGNHDWINSDPTWDLGFQTFVEPAAAQPPVVTLAGGPLAYTENDPALVLDPTATVADPDTPMFDGGTLTVSLTANANVTDRLGIRHEGSAAGQVGVSGSTVSYEGRAIGTFTGGTGTTPLVVTFNPSASRAAVQAVVRNLTYRTLSDIPTTDPRTIEVVLTDGDGTTSAPVTTTVTVTAVNDAPVVTTNTPLSVSEGGTATITAARLTASDPDNAPSQVAFTVTTAPTRGTVLLNGSPTTTFTQADINAGLVAYQHNGVEGTSDSFGFTVTDGTATAPAGTFSIAITAANDPPAVTTNTGLTVVQGASVGITAARLSATDPDNTPAQVRFNITAAPAHGVVRRNNTTVTTFTQADVNAGIITYLHGGTGTAADQFTFTVTDGTNTTAPATVAITVLSNSQSFVAVSGFNPTLGTVNFTGDGASNLNDHLELFAVDIGGGQYALGHNLTDPSLAGNTDVDPVAAGVQQLILGSGTALLITVNLKAGDDLLGINNTGGHFTTPVSYDGGTGRDRMRLDGTLANTWALAGINAGTVTGTAVAFTGTEDLTGSAGDDTFVFAAEAAIGRLDGGAGTNVLDYGGLTTPVEVFLSAGAAGQTGGVIGFRTAIGGSAADLLAGSSDADVLIGGGGNDTVFGGDGNDALTGGAGNDVFIGGAGTDRVVETFPSVLAVTLLNTSLTGGADTGIDLLEGVEGASLTGGAGNNTIKASKFTLGSVTLTGGAGNDKLYGGTLDDLLVGGDGKDLLVGGRGNDTFTGGAGNDVLNGGAGDDLVRETDIAGTNVTLSSGRLKTDPFTLGSDVLLSINRAFLSLAATETVGRIVTASGFRTGPVTLIGGAGADTLIGTHRAGDLLVGGAGADTLNSGKGADTVDGGPDADVHVTLGGAAIDDSVIDL